MNKKIFAKNSELHNQTGNNLNLVISQGSLHKKFLLKTISSFDKSKKYNIYN